MELRLAILSVACFSCLVPPAFGTAHLGAKALAAGLAKGAAVKGAAVVAAKAAALKGAALLAKGAAAVAAKGIAAHKAKVAAMVAAHQKPFVVKPAIVEVPVGMHVVEAHKLPHLSAKVAALSSMWGTVQSVAKAKANVVTKLLNALQEKVKPKPVHVVYKVVRPARFYPVPV